jgi:hypothetical protein
MTRPGRHVAAPALASLVIAVACCSQDGTGGIDDGCGLSAVCAASPAEYDVPPPDSCASSVPVGEPSSPIDFGVRDVTAVLAQVGSTATVAAVTADDPRASPALASVGASLDPRPESYAVVPSGSGVLIVGRDQVGAMYGAFELAEELRLGAAVLPLATPILGAPSFAVRGYNPHIEMPENDEDCWYFLDASFWSGYLDVIAHARIDWLDLYSVQSLQGERQVNMLRYFATSATFPEVGIPADKRAANQAMLATVVEMARVRGIQFSILSGRSDLEPCGENLSGPANICPLSSQADLETYTREAVQDLATNVPGLWRIGIRIGESFEDAGFYARTYLPALAAAGGPGFYARTWATNRDDIEMLATTPGGQGALVEAKFSAEQLGPPYVPQNGSFPGGPRNWGGSYEYENYLDRAEPFTFVFHVWDSAAYRFFRYVSADRTRRTLASMQALSPRVAGFTVQAGHALLSQRDWWHANPADVYSPWTYSRDELEPTLYGRIGYDPSTSDTALRSVLSARVGTDGFWDAEQAGSDVVAWIVTGHECGPDSRDFMAQLEWVGPVGYWASAPANPDTSNHITCVESYHGPMDGFDVAAPFEAAQDLVAGRATARISPLDVARIVEADVATLRAASSVQYDPSSAWARDVARECAALADLGDYFARKLRGATALAVYEATGVAGWLATARTETMAADAAWQQLAADTAYFVDFADPYRTPAPTIGLIPQWSAQSAFLPDDVASLDAAASAVAAQPPTFSGTLPDPATWLDTPRPPHPVATLAVTPADALATQWTATVTVPGAPDGTTVSVMAKAFASTVDWATIPTVRSGDTYTCPVPGTGTGGQFAAEIVEPGGPAWREPDPMVTMPYVSLAP